jgi:NADPH2:quinone reductase
MSSGLGSLRAEAVRMASHGGPEVLELQELDVAPPGPGEVRVRHEAVGCNFADTYFRSGLYPARLPAGIGVEASGVIVDVGPGVHGFVPGDRVTYTGSPLGAYSTVRTMPADSLLALPDGIGCDTAAAMTMRGLTTAYLLRRIWPLRSGDTVLFHAAAGGVGLIFCQWAALLGIEVIGTVSSEAKAAIARAHGAAHVLDLRTDDVAARVKELTGGKGVRVAFDGVGRDTYVSSLRSLGRRGLLVCLGTASGPVPPIDATELVRRSLYVTRPALADYLADPGERAELVGELFDHVANGRIRIDIHQRYRLADAVQAHRDLESRATTGSSIFDLSLV